MPHFADVQIKYDVDGYGISGVITPQLSFSVPACDYDDTSELFPTGAQVILTCSNGMDIPRFYVSSRSYSNAKLNFTCYDRSYATDRDIAMPDDLYDISGYASISDVMDKIMAICGYNGYSDSTGIIGTVITKAKKDNTSGKTCRNILDDLSRACCGVWLLQNDTGTADVRGTLTLIPVDSGMGAVFTAEKYSDVYIGGTKTFRKFILTSGSERYTAGASETAYGTVEIETPFASAALAGALYNRLKDYTYKSWSCNKMLASIGQLAIIPSPSSLITFGSKQNLYVNNCTVSLTSTGIYASVGRNDADEDELAYHNRTEREIAMRVRIGALMGNTVITEKGAALVVKDEVNNKTVNYGFEMDESGVATFEGAIIDTILPTCKRTATTNGIALIADYGGKKLKYSYSEDADGNINLMRDEVNDDG